MLENIIIEINYRSINLNCYYLIPMHQKYVDKEQHSQLKKQNYDEIFNQ